MRFKKFIASLAMITIVGTLFSCGKFKDNLEDPALKEPTETLLTLPSEFSSVANGGEKIKVTSTTTADTLGHINVENGIEGKVTLTKIEGYANEEVKAFVRPDFGYKPKVVKYNETILEGTNGNYSFTMVAGESKLVVEYEPIQLPLVTPTKYDEAYANLLNIAGYDNRIFKIDNGVTINQNLCYSKEGTSFEYEGATIMMKIPDTYSDGKILVQAGIGNENYAYFLYEFSIDSHTFSSKTKPEEIVFKTEQVNPTTISAESTKLGEDYKAVAIEAVDSLIKKFVRHTVYNKQIDFFNLGFYNYPGVFKVDYVADEFVNEATSLEYGEQIAKIKNKAQNTTTDDKELVSYRMNGCYDLIYYSDYNFLRNFYVLVFEDKIRLTYNNGIISSRPDDLISFLLVDIPYDYTNKIQISGFIMATTNKYLKTIGYQYTQLSYKFELDNYSFTDLNFKNLTEDSFKIYGIDNDENIFLLDKPITPYQYKIAKVNINYDFKSLCANSIIVSLFDINVLHLIQDNGNFYDYFGTNTRYEKEEGDAAYASWHKDFRKIINSLAGKDPNAIEDLDLVIIKPNSGVQVGVLGVNAKIIIKIRGNQIQFGLCVLNYDSLESFEFLIGLPNEDRIISNLYINAALKVTDSLKTSYFQGMYLLENSKGVTSQDFKEVSSSNINEDLSLKENSETLSNFDLSKYDSLVRTTFRTIYKTLFDEFGNIDLFYSFGANNFEF